MVTDEAPVAQEECGETRLAIEGYRFYAQEAIEFASAILSAVSEILDVASNRNDRANEYAYRG
jgi:hypothetical protein